MSPKVSSTGTRLGFALPLLPWPVLIWIQSQGRYNWTLRHEAEALHAVHGEALWVCFAVSAAGIVLIFCCGRSVEIRLLGLVFVLLNWWALWSYLMANAAAYT